MKNRPLSNPPHNWLVRMLTERAVRQAAERGYLRGRMLDIGCGVKPYEPLLARHVREHVGIDHGDSPHGTMRIDIDASAYDVPLPSAGADSILCSAVLEHLEDADAARIEAHRLLRPGGTAVYAVAMVWHLYEEPRDFYRYTSFGLQELMTPAGFEVLDIRPLAGFWVTFAEMFAYYLARVRRSPADTASAARSADARRPGLGLLLDRIDPATEWAWLHVAVVRRPEEV